MIIILLIQESEDGACEIKIEKLLLIVLCDVIGSWFQLPGH